MLQYFTNQTYASTRYTREDNSTYRALWSEGISVIKRAVAHVLALDTDRAAARATRRDGRQVQCGAPIHGRRGPPSSRRVLLT